jgi:hypothetical protein
MSNTETLALISYIIGFVIFIFLTYRDSKDADICILPAKRNRCREKGFEDPWVLTNNAGGNLQSGDGAEKE